MKRPPARKGPLDLRLLRLAGRHRGSLAWLMVLSTMHALTSVVTALAAAGVVVQILAGEGFLASVAVLAGSLALRTVVVRLRPGAAHRVSSAVIAEVRQDALEAVARRGPSWVAGRSAGPVPVDVAGLLTTGLDPLRPWFAAYLPSLVTALVLPPSVLVLMSLLDLASAAVVLLTLPLVPLFAALVGWATQHRARSQYARGGHLVGHFLDVVRGLVTLKLVDRAERQVEAVRESSSRYARSTTRVLTVAFLSSTALDMVATVSVGLVAVGAGVRLAGGEMALWPALAVILLAPEAYRPLREAGAQFHESAQASAAMDQLAALELGRGEADPTGGDSRRGTAAETPVGANGVSINYAGRRAPLVLPDMQVKTGELAVVIGPSGVGKSTLLRVLAGVQRPDSGTAWATDAQYVPQRPSLPLARTVREALEAADQPDTRVQAVLKAVGLPVETLAAGLETALGDDGSGLSAGQRHRIALARAVLAATGPNAPAHPVLLLDEPTSHLDSHAEAAVVQLLQDLTSHGVTVVAAAHRSALTKVAERRIAMGTDAATRVPTAAAPSVASGATTTQTVPRRTGAEHPRKLLAGTRRWWMNLPPGPRFAIASAAGAASLLSGTGLTVAASWMIIHAAEQPPILSLSIAAVAVRAFAISRPLLSYAQRLAAHDAGLSLLSEWRSQVVAELVPRVPGRLTERRGRLLTRLVQDVDLRLSGVVAGSVPFGAAVLGLLGVAGALAWFMPSALLSLATGVVIAGVVGPWWAIRADRRTSDLRDRTRADLHDAVIGTVENAHVLNSPRPELLAVLERRTRHLEQVEANAARDDGRGQAISQLGALALMVGTSLIAAGAWSSGTASPEMVGILVMGSLVATEALLGIMPALRERFAGTQAVQRLAALRAQPGNSTPNPRQPITASGERGDELRVRNLTAGWGGPPPVHGLDLHVEPGQTVLIQGASGTGKTTLAMALLGLVAPLHGEISLGADRISDLPGRHWRRRIALAGEADHIFASTLRENLLLAQPAAADAHLQRALVSAQLGPWFHGLSAGLGTWLDSGGRVLSGGERRRLVIARTLLRDPHVLVLDEPTEGLDTATAEALLADLVSWAADHERILIIFSHRLEGLDRVSQRYHLMGGHLTATVPAREGNLEDGGPTQP